MAEEKKPLQWEKLKGIDLSGHTTPMLSLLLVMLEEEKKMAEQKLENVKNLMEKMNSDSSTNNNTTK